MGYKRNYKENLKIPWYKGIFLKSIPEICDIQKQYQKEKL